MIDKSRLKASIDFLNNNQGFKIGGLYLTPKENEFAVVGQTNYNDPDNLNKKIAIKELENIKAEFIDYCNMDSEFNKFFIDREIKFCLAYLWNGRN